MAAKRKPAAGTVQEVHGMIASIGGSLGPSPALVIFLRPWQTEDGVVQSRELRVEVPVRSERALSRGMEAWDGQSVVLSVQTVRKATKNLLARVVAVSPLRKAALAPGLAAERKRQARPKRLRDERFGVFQLERDHGAYEAPRDRKRHRPGLSVAVSDPDDERESMLAIRKAVDVFLRIERDLPKLRTAISRELLDTFNTGWRGNQKPLTATAFKGRLTLDLVDVGPRRVTLYFDCDGLFTDHAIEVRLTPALAVTEVCLAG